MFFRIIRHELKILSTSVTLELREDAHWDVVDHILKDLLPAIDKRLCREDLLHGLVDALLAERHGPPQSLKCRFIRV